MQKQQSRLHQPNNSSTVLTSELKTSFFFLGYASANLCKFKCPGLIRGLLSLLCLHLLLGDLMPYEAEVSPVLLSWETTAAGSPCPYAHEPRAYPGGDLKARGDVGIVTVSTLCDGRMVWDELPQSKMEDNSHNRNTSGWPHCVTSRDTGKA